MGATKITAIPKVIMVITTNQVTRNIIPQVEMTMDMGTIKNMVIVKVIMVITKSLAMKNIIAQAEMMMDMEVPVI